MYLSDIILIIKKIHFLHYIFNWPISQFPSRNVITCTECTKERTSTGYNHRRYRLFLKNYALRGRLIALQVNQFPGWKVDSIQVLRKLLVIAVNLTAISPYQSRNALQYTFVQLTFIPWFINT